MLGTIAPTLIAHNLLEFKSQYESDYDEGTGSDPDEDLPGLSTKGQLLKFQHLLETLGASSPKIGQEYHKMLVDTLKQKFPPNYFG